MCLASSSVPRCVVGTFLRFSNGESALQGSYIWSAGSGYQNALVLRDFAFVAGASINLMEERKKRKEKGSGVNKFHRSNLTETTRSPKAPGF